MPYHYSLQPFKVHDYVVMIFCIITLTECRQKADKIEITSHAALTDRIIAHADSLHASGDFRLSVAYLDSTYRNFQEAGPIDHWKKYQCIAKYYLNNHIEAAKVRLYTDSMMLTLNGREQQYKQAYAQTLFARGDVLMAEKKCLDAFSCYYDGYIYAQKNLDSCDLALFTGQLALIKYRQFQFREAIPYLREALDENTYCKKQDDFDNGFVLPLSWLNTLAMCYGLLGRTDSSIFYLRKALVLIHSQESYFPQHKVAIETVRGTVEGNLGSEYQDAGHYDSSRYFLLECIRINDRPGNNIAAADLSKIILGFIDMHFNRPMSLTGIFSQSEDSLKAIECNEMDKSVLMQYWYELKIAYHESVHKIDSSFFYQKKLFYYVDSQRASERDLRHADMESVFAARSQQYRLSAFDRDNQIKKSSLLLTIVSGSMVFIILLIVWRNLKRSRKHIAELTRLNLQVTEQNAHMQHALCALEQSQADNTRMMKIVAHDLRNPIGAIKMAASLITPNPADLAENKIVLDIITRSADNSLELVNDLLLNQARPDEIKKEPVDLQAMLQYCADLLKHKATAKGQHIELNTIPVILSGSREKLWRVISNLIANAIKFSPDGAAIHVGMEKAGQCVRIFVKDNGIGIPEEMKNRIFDMFTEAKRPGTAGEQPFGLGLAISKQIVEAHGGKIWFESKPGNGTTFWVELPDNENC